MSINPLDVHIEESEDKCMICLENLSGEQQYSLPECAHTFHQNCIMHWFRSGSHKCPLCNNLGVNDTSSPSIAGGASRWGWWRGGKHKYNMLRQYARRKDAPLLLKKEIVKLKKLEERQRELRSEIKEFKNKVGKFKDLHKEWGKYRRKRWRMEGRVRQKRMAIANFNIVPIIIAKKVTLNDGN